MRSLVHLAVFAIMLGSPELARATDVSGIQTGTWTQSGSPYLVVGDVTVPAGQSLTIESGVTVNAQGYYRITVNGTLLALGATDQPILMTATDHATGWRGLRLLSADDATTIQHCVIEYAKGTGGFPEVRGGAIYAQSCSPTIVKNELRYCYSHNANSNGTGAGITTETSHALIEDNYIHDSQADSGGGICMLEYGSPVVRRNLIAYNTGYYAGGGMYFGARSSPIVENNLILHNSAGGWGGGGINSWTAYIYYGTFATIRNNVIAWNTGPAGGAASGGGGVYCRYDRAVLSGNTIAHNQAGQGGGIYALNYYAQAPLVSNCILWGNTATQQGAQIYLYAQTGGSGIDVSYTDVQDGWSGTGNLADDPLFVAPAGDDFHLQPGSPCTDAGDPAFQELPGETDIDGQPRVWDGDGDGQARVDMGADEYRAVLLGDLNCDGTADGLDIGPFVLALLDPAGYAAAFPNCNPLNGDLNGDGQVNDADVQPFVVLLLGS